MLELLLFVLLQQLADEVLGQLTGVTEELLIKLIIYGWNVPQGVLFGFPQERWSTTQPGTRHQRVRWCCSVCSTLPEVCIWLGCSAPCCGNEVHSQDVGDDSNAPHVGFQSQRLIVDNLWSWKGKQMTDRIIYFCVLFYVSILWY